MSDDNTRVQRLRLTVQGRVQGVGFRPAVYRLANELNLGGFVGNDSAGAFIEIEGPPGVNARFIDLLPTELPARATVAAIDHVEREPTGEIGFTILHSESGTNQRAEISPEIAMCSECHREMLDTTNHRYRYPFINCTNCGPRYSIVQEIPYDRRNTTMSSFIMCPACQAEYDDPSDRRFHAQPNACPECGPSCQLVDHEGRVIDGDAIVEAAKLLNAGRIVAIKGLGGFHLACRADMDDAVCELRRRKGRDGKPFAIMVETVNDARELAVFGENGVELLSGWRSPIVLALKKSGAVIAPSVAAGCDSFGVMLPYTPLHVVLMTDCAAPLVMTSANPSDEPLCRNNDEALRRLSGIADAFLLHDRDIERGVDDSVVIDLISSHGDEVLMPIRRSRGYVPEPIRRSVASPEPILAVGGDLKSVVAIAIDDQVVLSEHLGDLANPAAYRNFIGAIDRLRSILRVEPRVCVCDLHPDYHSTRLARTLGLELIHVQHHHAHIESCRAEHGLTGPVLGLAADGTGYGDDGTIWGCEFLLVEHGEYKRLGHLDTFRLAGGDLSATEGWRSAMSLLMATYGDAWRDAVPTMLDTVPEMALKLTENRIATGRAPNCSSLGRLFDAVAYLSGICERNDFEAQAAMALESAAMSHGSASALPFDIIEDDDGLRIDWRPMVRAVVEGRRADVSSSELAAGFHAGLVEVFTEIIRRVCNDRGLDRVILSGGCFLNRVLTGNLLEQLARSGVRPYIQQSVPTGDGGLALGQVSAAIERMRRRDRQE